MTLHIEHIGEGPDLILLHGWGFHSVIWQPIIHTLSSRFRVTLIDLPGHGRSSHLAWPGQWHELAEQIPDNAICVAWSLGGVVALALSQLLNWQKLIFIGYNPCWLSQTDWPGWSESHYQQFCQLAETNMQKCLQRFLTLQVHNNRQFIRDWYQLLYPDNEFNSVELQRSLALFAQLDQRTALSQLNQPTLQIFMEQDTIVPSQIIEHLRQLPNNHQLELMPGAGHCPMITHSDALARQIIRFAQ